MEKLNANQFKDLIKEKREIKDFTLKNIDISGLSINVSLISGFTFENVKMTHTVFGSDFVNVSFINCDLSNCILRRTSIFDTRFTDTFMNNIYMYNVTLSRVIFENTNMVSGDLCFVDMCDVSLSDVNMGESKLVRIEMERVLFNNVRTLYATIDGKPLKEFITKIQEKGYEMKKCTLCGSYMTGDLCPACNKKKIMTIESLSTTQFKARTKKIDFLKGRPDREKVIQDDDITNLKILLNTCKTIEDFISHC